ncbi:MAG: sialate O-acetylesterase, partial [Bacteroidota bacterium]|nr:sialate O-acetylesterase [Bacteroidota bacterium]
LNWKRINIPGYWEDQGIRDLDGVVWYRRVITVPESMTGVEATVKLGRIVNADEFYINGQEVGKTTYEYPQRVYKIKSDVLKPGKNLFVVRVTNTDGKGGFVPDKPYFLLAANDTVDLKGDWYYKVGDVIQHKKTMGGTPMVRPVNPQQSPTGLYNGMIAPYTNYAVKGFLWYQGEANADNPQAYAKLLPALIKDWRDHWQLGNLTFLIAQLPNFMDVNYSPEESNWAKMRAVQLETAEKVPNTGVGVNIDLGEWNDIHPGNKKPVGERLALQAMKITYDDKDILSSGPIRKSARLEGNKIIISFDNVGGGLVSGNGEELSHFAIAGEDGVYQWANAEIKNNEVVVWNDKIGKPVSVRYAWADNPDFANLYNKEGLPASPFQIDIK